MSIIFVLIFLFSLQRTDGFSFGPTAVGTSTTTTSTSTTSTTTTNSFICIDCCRQSQLLPNSHHGRQGGADGGGSFSRVTTSQSRTQYSCCSMVLGGGGGGGGNKSNRQVAGALVALILGSQIAFSTQAVAVAGTRTRQFDIIGEVEKLDRQQTEYGELKRELGKSKAADAGQLPFVQRKQDLGLRAVGNDKLQEAVQKIEGLAPYLDETEYLVTSRKWDYLQGFLGVFSEQEEEFVDLIDGLYPSDNAVDTSAREAMQYEAQQIFLALDDLYQASKVKKVKTAEKAYVKLALSYDRFLKAGGLSLDTADDSSVGKFQPAVDDKGQLIYDKEGKPQLMDLVILLKGPDRGREGKLIGIIKSRGEAIVRFTEAGYGQRKEVVLVDFDDVGKRLNQPESD